MSDTFVSDSAESLGILETLVRPAARAGTREAESTAAPMISVDGMGVAYGAKTALEDVSMLVPERRITAFIGPSGCGKSTALRCFNRMNDGIPGFRISGSVMLDGQDVYARGINVTALRRAVGMVFQQPNPFPMSIYDNIALAVREHERRISRSTLDGVVEQALRQASLWDEVSDCLTQSALSLSGGQQQRLCIARALAVKPTVIMLDEPCASLDPISTGRIEELLIGLSADYTIVIVTHNLSQAQRISDKVGFFLMGRLVEFGDALQVFQDSARPETAEYVRGAFG